MPRVDVTPADLTTNGVFVAGTVGQVDGNAFVNTGREFVELQNANGSTARVVTFPTPGTIQGQPIDDEAVSIPAASRRLIGPFGNIFNQADGKVYINYVSGAEGADITVRAYRFPS